MAQSDRLSLVRSATDGISLARCAIVAMRRCTATKRAPRPSVSASDGISCGCGLVDFSAEPFAFCAWRASACTSCASRLVSALAQQSSHRASCRDGVVGRLKALLVMQMQRRPLSHPSRALLPASSVRKLDAQAWEPLLLLSAPERRRRGKAMDELGWSHLSFSPLVSMREREKGYFPAVSAGRGGAGFPVTPPSILPQALCLPGPGCRR
jgi:hypothetical protein